MFAGEQPLILSASNISVGQSSKPRCGNDFDEHLDYLRMQVLASRTISGGRWVDGLLGGLNYQIEHHLFPGMPRPNLRRGVAYSECGLFASYTQVLRHLHAVGAPLRRHRRQVAAAGC